MLGVAIVWTTRKVANVDDGVVLTALIVVPALLYLVLRGSVAELRAPGGWAASFVRVARTTVNAGGEPIGVEDLQIIEKRGVDALKERIGSIDPDQPVLMCLKVGVYYSPADIRSYLDTLSQFPRFRLVAFLKTNSQFVGCITPTELRTILQHEDRGEELVQKIAREDVVDLKGFPGLISESVRFDDTNAQALSVMAGKNLHTIAVVDKDRTLVGVVEREHLVSKLVLSLASTSAISS